MPAPEKIADLAAHMEQAAPNKDLTAARYAFQPSKDAFTGLLKERRL